jgi:hypothetical protein
MRDLPVQSIPLVLRFVAAGAIQPLENVKCNALEIFT